MEGLAVGKAGVRSVQAAPRQGTKKKGQIGCAQTKVKIHSTEKTHIYKKDDTEKYAPKAGGHCVPG